jgi:hypothetical protein
MRSTPRYRWEPIKLGAAFENIIHGERFDHKAVFQRYYRRRLRIVRADGISLSAARHIAKQFAERDVKLAEQLYVAISEKRARDLAGEPITYRKHSIERDGVEQAYRDRRHTGKYRASKVDKTK